MSFSSGTFSINTAGQPVVSGTTISSVAFNAFTADIASGLSNCLLKDGTQTATARIPFASGISVTTDITTPSATLSIATPGGTQVQIANAASAVNFLALYGGATGSDAYVSATGTDASVSLSTVTRGSGAVKLNTGSATNEQVRIAHTASSTVWLILTGSAGNAAQITASATQPRLTDGLRVGADSSNNLLDDASNGASSATLYIGNASINVTSDKRLKANIVDTQRDALDIVRRLRVVDHNWDDPTDQCENNRNSRGVWTSLIAQEAIEHVPWIVNKPLDPEDRWHLEPQNLVPLLVRAIQQLADR